MKTLLPAILLCGLFTFSGCGPSEEEKEKMDQEAGEAVDSLIETLESEMGNESESSSTEPAQEEQPTTKESEEAPK